VLKRVIDLLRHKARGWLIAFAHGSKLQYLRDSLQQAQLSNDHLMSLWLESRHEHPNPLLRHGRKFFSQADEDGILLEILRRTGIEHGVCVEIGAGNGMENNTLNLLARGWPTVWVDAGGLAFDERCNPKLLSFQRDFVTVENVVEVVSRGLSSLDQSHVDVLSIDVDGNDGYLAEELLRSGLSPRVVIIETNEVVPPPIRFAQPYEPRHTWNRTKNIGWSLQSLADLVSRFQYSCVACNYQTGVNAFFVRNESLHEFEDVPRDLLTLYVGRSGNPVKYRDRRTQLTPELVEAIIRSAVAGS